jgi:tRNA pseudouridine55 synthase
MPDGFLNLDKPLHLTSAHLLNKVKRLLPRGTKLGHAGTLDPLASGVLVAMVGKYTKKCEEVMGQPKQYRALIRLGATSITEDAEGPITPLDPAPAPPGVAQVDAVLSHFLGTIEQLPPTFSALKIGGKRACDRVRAGEVVELKPRSIRIDAIARLDYAWPDLTILVDCGRGTYIRSLARDIGAALGTGGYLAGLVRTRVGAFRIEESVSLETLIEKGIEPFLIEGARAGLPASESASGATPAV